MRLTRKSSIILAFVIIGFFFGVAHLTAPRSTPILPSEPETPAQNSSTAHTTNPQDDLPSQFELTNFQRSESKNGKKIWEVTADNGKYFPEQEMTRLRNVKVLSLRSEDSRFTVSADSADVKLHGPSLTSADLQENVVATINDEVTIKTKIAFYDYEKNLVEAPGFVSITGPFYSSVGDRMSARTDEEIITLEGNVRTIIEPVPKQKG
jgi:LPS export ABC transporter protein LptC